MFTVVIPVFNAAGTLARAVDSVLAQTFGEFELIVVDDGSTDGGPAKLPAPLDPRVTVTRQPNAGEGAARNRGIEAATHRWIALLDADDHWLPEHLAELDRVRRRCPEAALIGARAIETDFSGRYSVPPEDANPVIGLIPYFERMAREPRPLLISSAAIDREVVEEVGGFERYAFGADTEFFTRIALHRPVAASTRATAVHTHGTGGVTESGSHRWRDAPMRSPADISPAVATLLRHCDSGAPPAGADAFVDRYIGWCLRTSARIGDVDTIRALRPMYRRPPPAEDRVLLAVRWLPAPLARLLGRPVSLISRIVGRLTRPLRATGPGSSQAAPADP
jgi:glycosyltransferase involved in cell wall biosynthesis